MSRKSRKQTSGAICIGKQENNQTKGKKAYKQDKRNQGVGKQQSKQANRICLYPTKQVEKHFAGH